MMGSKNLDKVKIKTIYKSTQPNTDSIVKIKNDFINSCEDYNVDIYSDPNDPSKTVSVASKNDASYTSESDESFCQNYILIVNKKKGRARLLPVSVRNLSEVDMKSRDVILPEVSDYRSKMALLSEKFGSKRMKRQLELSSKMTVSREACEQQLKSIVDETVIDESYLEEPDDGTESLEQLLPPCNRFASTPQFVYNLNDLLDENERSSLKEAAEYFLENGPSVKADSCSDFFISHYQILEKNLNIDRLVILLYADCLLSLLKARSVKSRDEWTQISPYSKLLISKLKKNFTDCKRVTTFMSHKIACHVLVAVLIGCDYKVHIGLISSCFRGIDSRKLQQLCRLVGLSSSSKSSNDTVLKLKLPLPPLPSARSPKMKRR